MSQPATAFTFAFQPIVDVQARTVFAHEALIRGTGGEPAATVLGRYSGDDLLWLDHQARLEAVRQAAALHLSVGISLNFSPAVLDRIPHSIAQTIEVAQAVGLQAEQLILEVTEGAAIRDAVGFAARINEFRSAGVRLAIDDFGAGYAGLNLLAEFQPDIVKIDMELVRDIDSKGPRQAIARAVIQVCNDLGLEVVAEGVQSPAEFHWFVQRGVRLFQGFLFGRPAWRQLAEPVLPVQVTAASAISPHPPSRGTSR